MKKSGVFSIVLASLAVVLVLGWLGGGATAVHAATFTVNSTTDAVDANPGNGVCATSGGVCTLRAAIQETNALAGADTINLPAGTYTLAIAGENEDNTATGDLDILESLIIQGADSSNTTIDGNSLDRVIDIKNANNVTFSNLTVQNGRANDTSIFQFGGGAIRNSNTELALSNVVLKNNTAINNNVGGALLLLASASVQINDSTITGNTASKDGGAIAYNLAVDDTATIITIEDSFITQNHSTDGYGGGIAFPIGDANDALYLKNTQFIDNSSSHSGGALYLNTDASKIEISNSYFQNNISDSGGAAIVNFGDGIDLSISNTTFSSNTANSWGGAMYITGLANTLSIEDSTFTGNRSNSTGGAIALYGPGPSFETVGVTAYISNSSFVDNDAYYSGGALYHGIGTEVSISHSAFISNAANNGGGMYSGSDGMTGGAYAYVTNSTFSGNSAREYGGGLYAHTLSTDGSLRNVTIAHNIADSDSNGSGDGGGIAIYNNASFSFSNSLIANNIDTGNEAPDCFATYILSWANNLIGKTDGCTFTPNEGDLLGTIASPLDPKLDPLTGSPAYHPLEIDSPAIDTGLDAPPIDNPGYINCMTTDQAGSSRPIDGDGDGSNICDIGATEAPTRIPHLVEPAVASTLIYTNTQSNSTVIDIPTGTVTETTTLFFMPQTAVTSTANMSFANNAFTLNAYRFDELLPGFVFEQPITVTIHYSDDDIAGVSEETLALLYWNGTMWSDDGISIIERDLINNKLVASVQHLSEFGMFGQSHQVYLPFISR